MNFVYSLLFAFSLFAIPTDVPNSGVEIAFNSQDATKIASYGKEKTLVQVLDKKGFFTNYQFSQVLKDFFIKHEGGTFKYSFKATEESGVTTSTGNYTCKSEVFRVIIKWKSIGKESKMDSFSIER